MSPRREGEACCCGDGTIGKVRGRAEEALVAGSGRSDGTASGGSPSAASAAALLCRAKIEKEEREERSTCLTRDFLKIFHGSSKKFEHESCSKFKFLQLSFQAKIHLSNDLKVILNFQKL